MKTDTKERIIKKIAIVAMTIAMGPSIQGCTSLTKTETSNKTTYEQTEDANVDENNTENIENTEKLTETEEVSSDKLNINDNASIEKTVDNFYEEYKEYCDLHGINKDQIRNLIFVINDKYTDENGNLLFDDDMTVLITYAIANDMLYSSSISQKIDNIITTEVSGYDTNNDWKIEKHPSLIPLVDESLAGSSIVVSELKEYETLRDYEIDYMNENNKIDVDAIDKYVIKNEVIDVNKNSNPVSSVYKNGQLYLMAATHTAILNMDAKVNTNVIYLQVPQYDNIPAIKINPTNAETDMESLFISLMESRSPEEREVFNNVITDVQTLINAKKTDGEIAEYIEMKYSDVKIDDSNLIIRYYKYRDTMQITAYENIKCNAQAKTIEQINSKRKNKEYSKGKQLIYTA